MKRKIIALCLIVAMLGVAVVGSTLAYFTDSEQATNVFTVGNIDIELDEDAAVLDADDNELSNKLIEREDGAVYTNIMPTNYLKKEVTITNKENPAYVRVVVLLNNHLELWEVLEDAIDQKAIDDNKKIEEKNALYNKIFDGWNITFTGTEACGSVIDASKIDKVLAVDTTISIAGYHLFDDANIFQSAAEQASHDEVLEASEGGLAAGQYAPIMNSYERCYVYYMYLEEDESVTLFKGLNCPANFTQAQAKIFEDLKIEIYADAIQAESFAKNDPTNLDNAKKAFEALEVAHPLASIDRLADSVVLISNDAELKAAIEDGKTDLTLKAGNYTLPTMPGKTVTISGTKDAVIDASQAYANGAQNTNLDITFDGVTVTFGTKNYLGGFAHADKVVYKNCKLIGKQTLYANTVEFINCELDTTSVGAEHTAWTWGAKNISFTDCTFTYGDRAVNCYGEHGDAQTVTFTGCKFITTNAASEGAVEINSMYFTQGIDVVMNDCTAPANGPMVYVSPWDSQNGAKTTITIDGVEQ
ncbi:MAG: hypothetical protein E7654_00625 [Ruminococcaceae bacterium]|nr:hypothetical protein [Oscillospiraceae bacterium]